MMSPQLLTPEQIERRRKIIAQLCELSCNGWRNAKPCDYQPLEAELRRLLATPTRARRDPWR
jgi:hypothetical protein